MGEDDARGTDNGAGGGKESAGGAHGGAERAVGGGEGADCDKVSNDQGQAMNPPPPSPPD